MSSISLTREPSDTITTYGYYYKESMILKADIFRRCLPKTMLPLNVQDLFSTSVTYVIPADREKLKTHYPNNHLLEAYLKGCALVIPRDSLDENLPTEIISAHEYNSNTAFQTLKSLADDNNDAAAQLTMWNIYSEGAMSPTEDQALAYAYLKKAVDQDFAPAISIYKKLDAQHPETTDKPITNTLPVSANIEKPVTEKMQKNLRRQINALKRTNHSLKNQNIKLKDSLSSLLSIAEEQEANIKKLFAILAQKQFVLPKPPIQLAVASPLEVYQERPLTQKRDHKAPLYSAPKRQKLANISHDM